jgi:uncharacterized protein (TIGR02145 family)
VAVGYSFAFGTGDWAGITGKGESDAIIVKYDNAGNVVWKKNFGGSSADSFDAVATVSDGVATVGYSAANSFGNGDWTDVTGNGNNDAIIIKHFDVPNEPISNIQADFSCPGQVTVTYNLYSPQPVDITLYYSHNQCNWLIAQTVSGDLMAQTTGIGKTIIWNNYADNVRFGKFYFKVEMPELPCEGIKINGLCWAHYNVNMPGTFAPNPENAGMFYQWGSNVGWSNSNPLWASDGINTWRNLSESGNIWLPEKNPCPVGWRVPTMEEFESLINDSNYWGILNGFNGRFFGNEEHFLFLPAAGYRMRNSGTLSDVGTTGYYWSASGSGMPFLMYFNNNSITTNVNWKDFSFSVRCVKE